MEKWLALRETLQKEAGSMEKEVGERIVDVNLLSESELMLIHKKTFKRLRLTFLEGMESLRVEDAAGRTSLERIPEFVPTLAVDLLQRLS